MYDRRAMSVSQGSVREVSRVALSTRTLHLALLQLGIAALALTSIELALFLHVPTAPVWVLVLYLAVGFGYVLAGLLAWSRRPGNRIGALLCLGGFTLLLSALQNTDVPGLLAAGLILAEAPIAVILHILLAFPSGRLERPLPRALVGAGYVITIVLEAPRYLFASSRGVLDIAQRPDLAHIGVVIQDVAGAVVLVLSALVLAFRLWAASASQRRVLGLLYGYGIFAILFLEVAANVLPPLFGFGPITVFVLQISAAAGIPIVFTVGVLSGRFARTAGIEELGMWLGSEESGRPQLRDALARAFADESLELLFFSPEDGTYLDPRGRAAELPEAGSGRASVEIELGGARVGAIAYDSMLIAEPGLVRAAGRVIALALERERLTGELIASRDALRESRARIVEAADRERRRIARDLHDSLQAQLVTLAMKADRIASSPEASSVASDAAEVRAGLEDASEILRGLVQGVMPALLIERGLYAATEDLVDRMPVPTRLELSAADRPLPDSVVSTGYFVVAEALTNAIKHSKARELAVSLARPDGALRIEVRDDGVGGARVGGGWGLRGMADRLDVLGGRLVVDSPRGGGTLVVAEVPCES
jgi:signal transduction histidine kinase